MIPRTSHIRILGEMLMHQFQEMRRGKVYVVVIDDSRPWMTVGCETGGEGIEEWLHACVSHLGEEFDTVVKFPIEGGESGFDVDVFGRHAEEEKVFAHGEGDDFAAERREKQPSE